MDLTTIRCHTWTNLFSTSLQISIYTWTTHAINTINRINKCSLTLNSINKCSPRIKPCYQTCKLTRRKSPKTTLFFNYLILKSQVKLIWNQQEICFMIDFWAKAAGCHWTDMLWHDVTFLPPAHGLRTCERAGMLSFVWDAFDCLRKKYLLRNRLTETQCKPSGIESFVN